MQHHQNRKLFTRNSQPSANRRKGLVGLSRHIIKAMGKTRLLAVTLGAAIIALAVIAPDAILAENREVPNSQAQILKFDVAENATRFAFDEAPVDDNGMPAYGNPFVTQGYIYPEGTLDGNNGVQSDGKPEFPEQVIGQWICRGWFIGDGAATETGPWVITHQLYNFSDQPGRKTLMSDGYELAEPNVPIQRAIVGGTGPYKEASGQAVQTLLGFNQSEGVDLRFVLEVETKRRGRS